LYGIWKNRNPLLKFNFSKAEKGGGRRVRKRGGKGRKEVTNLYQGSE
jgi:hypothetical protein